MPGVAAGLRALARDGVFGGPGIPRPPRGDLWRLELAPRAPPECASTCIFAFRNPAAICCSRALETDSPSSAGSTEAWRPSGRRDPDAFGNETLALGAPHRIDDWWIASEAPSPGRVWVLATDGVADDLDPERLGAFVDWLSADVGRLAPSARWRRLCRELRDWPVPHHLDDKTIVVLAENAGETGACS